MRRAIIALVLLALAGGGAFWMQRGSADHAVPPPAEPVAMGVGALGRVEPASRLRRLAAPGGMNVTRIDRLLVAEGDRVQAGQLLAEFADTAQKAAAVEQSRAGVAEARASLERTLAAGRPSEIAAQQARIRNLTAIEAINRRDAERSEKLVPTGAGAAAVADRNRATADAAAAARVEAEATLETLSRPRPEDVALAEARLASAEAALRRSEADLELSRLRAPITGTVLKIYARPGDQLGADGLLDLADLDALDVVADVYETDIPRLRPGAPAEVIIPGDPQRHGATVREIGWLVRRNVQATTDPIAAVDARTVEVRLTLDDAARRALRQRINMQVQVAIRP